MMLLTHPAMEFSAEHIHGMMRRKTAHLLQPSAIAADEHHALRGVCDRLGVLVVVPLGDQPSAHAR